MTYTPASLSWLIKAVIDNKACLREWDDLVSVSHKDQFTEIMAQRLLDIQTAYSGREEGIFLNNQGIDKLRDILIELGNIESGA